MSHDVFISYSSKDKNAADAVCAVLERNNIRCWIAPRDVLPGAVWGAAIIGAIQAAKIIVLVFSGAANTSPQIEREVERAISKGIPIIPFRIEDVQPRDSLEYFISASHWLDAFTEPLEAHLETLARVVQRVLEVKQVGTGTAEKTIPPLVPVAAVPAARPTAPTPVAATAIRPQSGRWMIAAAAALAACLAAVTLYFELTPGTKVVAASRKVGDVFRDCANCPEMVVVPAGRFMMGASDRELSDFDWARPGEVPVHEVRIAKPFAAGVFPVTRDEFAAFVKETNMPVDGGCYYWNGEETLDPTRSFMDPKLSGGPQAGDHPVVCVSHEEATRYVAWLSDRTGRNYRLLSDAEHEYVTRAGTTSAFWWGPTISPDQANYWSDASYHGSPTKPARFTTLPVKSFQPNPWGLYQVHGNVNEMVADCWHPDYVGAPADGSVWQMSAGGECKKHTGRGGSFINGPDLVRSAHRRETFDLREIGTGLRVAQTLAKLVPLIGIKRAGLPKASLGASDNPRKSLIMLMEATTRIELVYTVLQTVA